MSRNVRNVTIIWHIGAPKTRISQRSLNGVFLVRVKKLGYLNCGLWRFRSVCANAHAALNIWRTCSKVHFLIVWLIFCTNIVRFCCSLMQSLSDRYVFSNILLSFRHLFESCFSFFFSFFFFFFFFFLFLPGALHRKTMNLQTSAIV